MKKICLALVLFFPGIFYQQGYSQTCTWTNTSPVINLGPIQASYDTLLCGAPLKIRLDGSFSAICWAVQSLKLDSSYVQDSSIRFYVSAGDAGCICAERIWPWHFTIEGGDLPLGHYTTSANLTYDQAGNCPGVIVDWRTLTCELDLQIGPNPFKPWGDCNGDQNTTLADVFCFANQYFSGGEKLSRKFDLNCDEIINIVDLVWLVNHIFRCWEPPY